MSIQIIGPLLLATAGLFAQRPVINPGGVVNAASYATGGWSGKSLGHGTLAAIFGKNLAQTQATAPGFPLPTILAGTAVTVNGARAPLFYVSPNQINFEIVAFGSQTIPLVIAVSTAAGVSEPESLDNQECFGIFTLDGSGCGRGAVFNVGKDGKVSLNSPSNSVAPGDYLTVYGTGLLAVFSSSPLPGPGVPAPASPLARSFDFVFAEFDFGPGRIAASFAGRAPGWVGLDQVNIQVPETVREGCAVPLRVYVAQGPLVAGRPLGYSQPVVVAIHKGGGQCVEPPTEGYGQITWERTEATGIGTASGVTETLTAMFAGSPGKQAPSRPAYEARCRYGEESFGAFCGLPGRRSFDAGRITIQGQGFGPLQAVPAVSGDTTVYQAKLPAGTIRAREVQVEAGGGNEVGAFRSAVRIGSPIQVTSPFPPGTVLPSGNALGTLKFFDVTWTGGDPDSWVRLKIVGHNAAFDSYTICEGPTSVGKFTITQTGGLFGSIAREHVEIILEVVPGPSQDTGLSIPGLSLGGEHSWKYTYRFGGLRFP